MSVRIIPRRTKVRAEFFRGVGLSELILGLIGVAGALLLFTSAGQFFSNGLNYWLGLIFVILCASLYAKLADDERMYVTMGYLFKFFAQQKSFFKVNKKGKNTVKDIIPFEGITQDRYISYGDYFAQVLEIQPMAFGLLNEEKQEMMINTFANALRRISAEQTASIIKVNKPMVFDQYVYNEDKKYDKLLELQYEGEISQREVEMRAGVFEERVSRLESMNRVDKIFRDHFYFMVFDKDKELLDNSVTGIVNTLAQAVTPLYSRRLYGQELAVFMRSQYGKDFDERELDAVSTSKYVDWATPKEIKFTASRVMIDKKPYRTFVITDYPIHVGNAWGANIYVANSSRVVTKIHPLPRYESEKTIDKAIMEMEIKLGKAARSSTQIENQTHLETLRMLLQDLKNANEQLYNVSMYIMCEESLRKEVRAQLRQDGFKYTEMFARQVDAFIGAGISRRDPLESYKRGIPTTSLAAMFPFISGALQDPGGIYIGDNEYPVFVDFFKRDRERVNSNMMVIGKSGSGKTFATKMLLANFAADNTKMFILDPEKEYSELTENMGGKTIDVGSSSKGIINPFHIITSLEGDDEDAATDDYSIHLQFLEQFFRVILEGIDTDSFEALNSAVIDIYKAKGVDKNSDFNRLKPSEFPIFDDLYAYILKKVDSSKSDYHRRIYMTIETYVKKFATGGRNSNLWNGPTSINTKENFIVFNFNSLLANKNDMIARAQMLLVFKYLDNEIIKNKDFNSKFKTNRKIIIVVDEAHVYINPKYPIALDFMMNMAKRIRKYGGMQIIITQNIKDFVGSPEIARQSTAVINACQYSCIFALAPNDMHDLVALYEKAGGINKEEQNAIVTAGVGQAFLVTSPTSRTMVQIMASSYVRQIFETFMY